MSGVSLLKEDIELGEDTITNDFYYKNNVSNASVNVRLGFLRKVYSLLLIQLLATISVGVAFTFNAKIRLYVHNNDWLVSLTFLFAVIILIALHINRKSHPLNLILLAAFTVVEATTLSVVITFYDLQVVLQALVLTFVVVTSLTAFTFQTKRDFSAIGLGLFAALLILVIASFLQLILGSTFLEFLIAAGGALLFSLFIIYDTQMMMTKVSPEEYILATINLYLDIINLFMHLLHLLEVIRR
nr:PREDICTED: protein lifeguard 4-like [Bemisia tabaci]